MVERNGGTATELIPEESAEVFSSGEQPACFSTARTTSRVLDAALAEAVAGTGGVMLIEGPAGIGKTVLLDAIRRCAGARRMTVLAARGGELERGFGFGIVRQLLEAALIGADARGTRSAIGRCGAAGRTGVHRGRRGRGHR